MMVKFKILFLLLFSSCSAVKTGQNCESYFDSEVNDYVYLKVDKLPIYLKGEIDLLNLLAEEINYPVNSEIQGRVIVSLIINEKGKVIKGGIRGKTQEEYSELEKEVLRIFKEFTTWKAGICRNKLVKFRLIKSVNILKR